MVAKDIFALEDFMDEHSKDPVKAKFEAEGNLDFEAICSLVEKNWK